MQVDKTARRQLAIMRWQHARAVLACEHKQSLMKLPSAKSHGALQQVHFHDIFPKHQPAIQVLRHHALVKKPLQSCNTAAGSLSPKMSGELRALPPYWACLVNQVHQTSCKNTVTMCPGLLSQVFFHSRVRHPASHRKKETCVWTLSHTSIQSE